MRAAQTCNEARWRSPFDITSALAGREVLALKVGDRSKLLQIVSPVLLGAATLAGGGWGFGPADRMRRRKDDPDATAGLAT